MHFMSFMPIAAPVFCRRLRAWRAFGIAMAVLALAFLLALFSAAASELGKVWLAGSAGAGRAGTGRMGGRHDCPARWRNAPACVGWRYQVDYRLTREGFIYLGVVVVLVVAAVNTGNNLLFFVLACLLAGILVSGALSRIVLADVELKFDLPEHIFAGQPQTARVELINGKSRLPSFSLRVRRQRQGRGREP